MYQNWNPNDPLPNAKQAEIDPRKFEEYSMKPDHPSNQGKWRGFVLLGYNVENPQSRKVAAADVINQLRIGLESAPATQTRSSPHGIRFEVRVRIQGPNQVEGNLFTSWQIDNGRDIPKLITNWVEVYT